MFCYSSHITLHYHQGAKSIIYRFFAFTSTSESSDNNLCSRGDLNADHCLTRAFKSRLLSAKLVSGISVQKGILYQTEFEWEVINYRVGY